MKKFALTLVIALPLLFLFSGCPVGIGYTLGTPGKEAIDKSLIGTWTTDGEDADFNSVTITKRDNFSYDIEVNEKGEMYSLDVTTFVGWVTRVEGKTFIYAQPVKSSDIDYYLYCYEPVDNKTMKSFDVGLLVNGVDGISSTETYREEVKASMGMEGFLTSETIWTRK